MLTVHSPDRLLEIEKTSAAARESAAKLIPGCLNSWNDLAVFTVVAGMLSTAFVGPKANLRDDDGLRVAGLLKQQERGLFLHFEAHEPVIRQRFSIAHELGHYFLHLGRDISDIDIETEADAFAAAFLMPEAELLADVTRYGPAAAFLAQRYEVSDDAMGQRLKVLSQLTANHKLVSPGP